ncbi:stimulated by retinoic acid gene 6 protein-like isoform X2 [Sphaerodactylus townsendi]|uniref:stimulated by retinoic acid gene 6 protein-like isoform X2 n=1 Tax=Sphaerodactylus townsendi TaxID=933632 RepID=UPI0020276AEF|nr:stimulated by retinoic acid gene 6 protein-like isoform X2 [Sphaerodactylus townsendi]
MMGAIWPWSGFFQSSGAIPHTHLPPPPFTEPLPSIPLRPPRGLGQGLTSPWKPGEGGGGRCPPCWFLPTRSCRRRSGGAPARRGRGRGGDAASGVQVKQEAAPGQAETSGEPLRARSHPQPATMEDADYENGEDFNKSATCDSLIDMEHYLHYSLAPSVVIILILACLEKRLRRWSIDRKLNKLYGRGGIVIPFDFVSMFSNRWSFGFAFGATADKLMFLFDQDFPQPEMPSLVRVFWVMLITIEVGLSSYPFFACLSTSYRKTGAILGFLYTLSWLIVMLIDIVQCPNGPIDGFHEYMNVILFWPSLVCQFFLLGRFLHILVGSLRICSRQAVLNEETNFLEVHQIQHVQHLLKKPPPQPPQKSWIRRMISTMVVVLICLYMTVMAEVMVYRFFKGLITGSAPNAELLAAGFNATELFSTVQEFFKVAEGIWVTATVTSALTCVTYVFHILVCYRKHMKRLRVGNKEFLLTDISTVSHSLSAVALARYSSWQIAYTLWGYLLMHVVQWVAGMVFTYTVILPMVHGQWKQLLDKWGMAILTFVLVMLIKKLQLYMAAWFFLQPKISPEDKQKPLALDNRKAYQNFTYFLFFYTVVIGLFSCLMRLLRSVAVGTWLIGRIDRTVMPKGYEAWDTGFKTWVGMLLMDHYHTNPCLVFFCHILVTRNKEKEHHIDGTKLMGTDHKVSLRSRTRWLLLYTLLNNPSLRKFRKPKPWPQAVDFPLNYSA